MSNNLDLNALRDRVLSNQNTGTVRPNDPAKSVTVDREGKMHFPTQPDKAIGPQSQIPQETFAASMEDDIATASQFLPTNTKQITTNEGVVGFLYTFNTELGDQFTLFAFNDGASYQVQVVSPKVEDRFNNPHDGHIFPNSGKICFGSAYNAGMPSLRDAYAKSVLWANGMSVAYRTGKFPFSNNN